MLSCYTRQGFIDSVREESSEGATFTTCTIIKGVGQSNMVTMATTLTSISKKNQACLKTVGLIRGSMTIHCSVSSSWNTYHNRVCGRRGRERGRGVM